MLEAQNAMLGGRLWMIHEGKRYLREYLPCYGVRMLSTDKTGKCRLVIETYFAGEKLFHLPNTNIVFEIHFGSCTDPSDFHNCEEVVRISHCDLKRQLMINPIPLHPDDDEGRISRFYFEGQVEACPWFSL